MKFLILGAGGIGSYFGARLIQSGHEVVFTARGKHLEALQHQPLKLQHPDFNFEKNVIAYENIKPIAEVINTFNVVLLTTKSTSTLELAKELSLCFANFSKTPYVVSLQNGVENEEILLKYLDNFCVIGGITRKIGSHIVSPSIINATGNAETILGLLHQNQENQEFLEKLADTFNQAKIPTQISSNIKLELWKKLVINNGVNALCAFVKEKTGVIMHHEKLSKIVYGLMSETAVAAKNKGVFLSKKDIDEMYELITKFDSIKPSMLVDVENNRELEIDEICNVVIKNCEEQNIDAPYTRTIASLLEFMYKK